MKTVTKQRVKCAHCGRRFSRLRKGRPARYCSPSCRQRAYEKRVIERKVSSRMPVRLLQEDLDEVRTGDAFNRAVISVLQKLGFLPSLPKPTRLRSKPRLVKNERNEDKGDLPPTSE